MAFAGPGRCLAVLVGRIGGARSIAGQGRPRRPDNPLVRLLRAADVPATDRDRVFRRSRARAVLALAAVAVVVAACSWLGVTRTPAAFIPVGAMLAVTLFMKRLALARFRESNWLARIGDTAVYLHYRSYLNHHFPPGDPTVIALGLGEIQSARLVWERRLMAQRDGVGSVERREEQVELRLLPSDELAQALATEAARHGPRVKRWFGHSSVTYHDHPLRLEAPGVLRIAWGASPGGTVFLEALRAQVRIEPPLDETRDFTRLAQAPPEEQERRLTELARSGRTFDAIAIARRIHGEDLEQARARIERLRGAVSVASGERIA